MECSNTHRYFVLAWLFSVRYILSTCYSTMTFLYLFIYMVYYLLIVHHRKSCSLYSQMIQTWFYHETSAVFQPAVGVSKTTCWLSCTPVPLGLHLCLILDYSLATSPVFDHSLSILLICKRYSVHFIHIAYARCTMLCVSN